MMFRPRGVHVHKKDSSRYAFINCMEQSHGEGMMFEYTTEEGIRCRLPVQDFWALYHNEDTETDNNSEPVSQSLKTAESIEVELDHIKKENKELKEELKKIKEELDQKKRVLSYSDGYIKELEETRKDKNHQIENYKKDILHVVRKLRK